MSALTDALFRFMDPGSAIGIIVLFVYIRGRLGRLEGHMDGRLRSIDDRLARLENTHIPDGGSDGDGDDSE